MKRIVVIGASAGGLAPLRVIIGALPATCSAAVFVVMHIGRNPSVLPSILARCTTLPAAFAMDRSLIRGGYIYVAPPDYHMTLQPDYIRLSDGPKAHQTRPAVDPLFQSAAEVFGKRVMGIVLSGGESDGAIGLRAIKERGGTALVQSPLDALVPSMPRAAMRADHPDAALSAHEIAQRVAAFCA